MQEHTVTSGTTTHELEAPFLVMATQNPIEMEGTYPLPEAQLDRFLMKILVQLSVARRSEHASSSAPFRGTRSTLEPVLDRDEILELRARLPPGSGRAARAGLRDRPGDGDAAGHAAGARAGQQVHPLRQLAARRAGAGGMRTRAGADARPACISAIEDVETVAPAVLRHRIILNFDAHAEGQTPETILDQDHPERDATRRRRQVRQCRSPLIDTPVPREAGAADHPLAEIVARAGRRPQHFALRRRRPGISRSSPVSSRRRSARGQLARLSAPGKAVPEDVPGGAAHSGAHAARHQQVHGHRRRSPSSTTRASWRRRCATSGWCAWIRSACSRSRAELGDAFVARRRTASLSAGGELSCSGLKPGGQTNFLEIARAVHLASIRSAAW